MRAVALPIVQTPCGTWIVAEREAVIVGLTRPSQCWWERRWFLVAILVATTVPLLYPPLPPLVDRPGMSGATGSNSTFDTRCSFSVIILSAGRRWATLASIF